MRLLNLAFTVATASASLAQYQVTTVAGGYLPSGPASTASIVGPCSVASDSNGNVYVAATNANVILRVDNFGQLTVIAGNGTVGQQGDGGLAARASLTYPTGLALNGKGSLLFADQSNRVRMINLGSGVITTVAGNGLTGGAGEGGPAVNASLDYPTSLAFDQMGNLYIAGRATVKRVASDTGIISTIAGNGVQGFGGDGGYALKANLSASAIALDAVGNLIIADLYSNRIRRVVQKTGIIETIVGDVGDSDGGFSGDGGPALKARIWGPSGVAVDLTGNIYIADSGNVRVRMVTASSGIITTVAGNGFSGFGGDGQAAIGASLFLNSASGLSVDLSGNLYIADSANNRIRVVRLATGIIRTFAGNGLGKTGGDGGPATNADLEVGGVTADRLGSLYIADWDNSRIRKVNSDTALITSVAASADPGPCPNDLVFRTAIALVGSRILCEPEAVAIDSSGTPYIASSGSNAVLRLDQSGQLTAVAGVPGFSGFSGDGGPATSASLFSPSGLVFDGDGNLFIVDSHNNRIRKVTKNSGTISTVAGDGNSGFAGDGGPPLAARFSLGFLSSILVDSSGNVYVADSGNNRIRRISAANGLISTVAGRGTAGFDGDGGPASAAALSDPTGMAISNDGRYLFVADGGNNRIRQIDLPIGTISTIAGNGIAGFGGDGGMATDAMFYYPRGITIDADGNLFVADLYNFRIRKLTPLAAISGALSVAPPSLSFEVPLNGSKSSQQLTITSNGGGLPVEVATSTSDGSSWLTVSPAGGNTPLSITVSASPSSSGTYHGVITVTCSLPGSGPITVPVTLSVIGSGLIVTTSSLSAATVGVPYGPAQLTASGGGGPATWSQTGLPATTGLSLSSSGVLTGTPSIGSQGAYTMTVTAMSGGLSATAQLSMTIVAPSTIDVLNFRLVPSGGSTLSDKQVFALTNDTSGPTTAVLSPSVPWLKLSQSQVAFDSSSKTVPVEVQVDRSLLPVGGNYTSGAISIQGLSSPEQVGVNVALHDQQGLPLLSRSAMTFYVQFDQTRAPVDNLQQTVEIINDGPTAVSWKIDKSDSFVSADPTSSTIALQPGESTNVKVTVTDRNLTAGAWQATLSFVFDDGTLVEFPVTVLVLNDLLPSELLLDQSGLIFVGSEHQNVTIASYLNSDFCMSAVPLQGWIRVSPTNKTLKAGSSISLDVSVDGTTAPLDGGVARGWITLGFQDASSGCPNSGAVKFSPKVEVLYLGVLTPSNTNRDVSGSSSSGLAACVPNALQAVFSGLSEGSTVAVGLPAQIDTKISDNCGNPVKTGAAAVSFSNGDPPVTLLPDGSGSWQGTWSPQSGSSAVLFLAAFSDQTLSFGTAIRSVQLDSSGVQLPSVPTGSVLNAATMTPSVDRVAPGSMLVIRGNNLSAGTVAADGFLPLVLGGTSVRLGGTPLPLLSVGPTQITTLVPPDAQLDQATSLVVESGGLRSIPLPVVSLQTDPGIFGAIPPASRGDAVSINCTGLGEVSEDVDATLPAPTDHLIYAKNVVAVFLKGTNGQWLSPYRSFAGLAPGQIGRYQVDFQIPQDAATGDQVELFITSGSSESNHVTITIH